MKCASCGTENRDEARFCKACGAPQTAKIPEAPAPLVAPAIPPPPPPPVRHRYPHEDLVGLLSFAFFLIAVAVVFGQNPTVLDGLQTWVQLVSANGTVFVRPPDPVIVSVGWFFSVVGGLEFVSAALRWALRWPPLRVVSRVLSGVGDLVLAFLVFRYADRLISGAFLLTVLIGVAASLLILYVTLGVYWSSYRPARWPGAIQPHLRP